MEKLRVGVIGAGFIGSLHARIYYENPLAELVAIADVNKDVARSIGEKFDCDYYDDYLNLINRDDIDAIDICVPEDFHVEVALAVANAKKNFLIEKPIAKTYKEAIEIIKAVEKNDVRIMVGQVLRFDPRYVQLNESIKQGELGTISSMSFRRINSSETPKRLKGKVSFFYYMGVHDIDWMLEYNKGATATEVYAKSNSIINKNLDQDAVFVIVTFDNGSIGHLELNWSYPENGICGFKSTADIIGTKGAGFVNVQDQGLLMAFPEEAYYPDTLHWPEYNGRINGDLKEEINHFINATLEGKDYLVDTNNAVRSIAIIDAAMKSLRTGLPEQVHF